jgi:hypothetical protein
MSILIKVSVIIPKYLKSICLQSDGSVLSNTLKDYEIIVFDS